MAKKRKVRCTRWVDMGQTAFHSACRSNGKEIGEVVVQSEPGTRKGLIRVFATKPRGKDRIPDRALLVRTVRPNVAIAKANGRRVAQELLATTSVGFSGALGAGRPTLMQEFARAGEIALEKLRLKRKKAS